MKKSELIIGNTYAYDRSRDELPSHVTKVKLISLESEGGYKRYAGAVLVEFETWMGWGENRTQGTRREYVQLYTLKGDYQSIINKIELRKKDREIQSLRGEIEKNRRIGVMNRHKGAFIEFGVSWYSFSEYRPDFTVPFTEEQFKTVSRLLETYNRDLAEAKAKAEEMANA
jgi:uncharacterized membrane-anchored protein